MKFSEKHNGSGRVKLTKCDKVKCKTGKVVE